MEPRYVESLISKKGGFLAAVAVEIALLMNLVIASSKFWKECSYRSYRTVSDISFNTIPPSHPNISIKTTSSNLLEEVLPPEDLQVNSKLGFSNNTWALYFPLPPLLTFVGNVVALLASSERPDGY